MTFQSIFISFGDWLISILGYTSAVHLKDFMPSLMTFVLGMLFMAFISSSFILRLHSVEDFGKSQIKVIRVDHKKKSRLLLSIPDIWSAFEALLFLSFSPFCTIKRFTGRDATRTKKFVFL